MWNPHKFIHIECNIWLANNCRRHNHTRIKLALWCTRSCLYHRFSHFWRLSWTWWRSNFFSRTYMPSFDLIFWFSVIDDLWDFRCSTISLDSHIIVSYLRIYTNYRVWGRVKWNNYPVSHICTNWILEWWVFCGLDRWHHTGRLLYGDSLSYLRWRNRHRNLRIIFFWPRYSVQHKNTNMDQLSGSLNKLYCFSGYIKLSNAIKWAIYLNSVPDLRNSVVYFSHD